MAETLRVAALQMRSGTDKEKNVASAIDLVHAAADQGATYVQLPEYCSFYGTARYYEGVSETVPGPTTNQLADVARERGISVHLGSVLETSPHDRRSYNTSVLIDASGAILATYRKVHLFDVDVPGEVTFHESSAIVPGSQLVVASLDHALLGLSICFDLRFAEWYRALALAGASVFAVPAAFSAATGPAHWEVLLRARAIENHAFVVAATQAGTTDEGLATHGHAMIIDPWGEVLAESRTSEPEVVIADLDLDQVTRRRREIDVFALRRPALYGEVTAHPANQP
ncbi:MAG: carbon-nitrogen hydrolase family protein [Acidimicrobiales bacterium]